MTSTGPATPYPQQPPAPRKRKVWPWVLAAVVLLPILAFAACTAIVGGAITGAVKEGQKQQDATTASRSATCKGKTYPDRQPANDVCANPAGLISLEGVQVTASPLRKTGNQACTNVAYSNGSKETISFNVFDWKLQLPTGEVLDAFDSAAAPGSLGSGDLIAGGKKTGRVCYETAVKGQHVLIYKPSFWSEARGIWLAAL